MRSPTRVPGEVPVKVKGVRDQVRRAVTMLAPLAAALAWLSAAEAAMARPVDLALVLAVDESGSISDVMEDFQLRGSAEAFRDERVARAIATGPSGAIAVTVVTWSSPHTLAIVVPWTVVGTADEAGALADAILAAPRAESGGSTAIGTLIDDAVRLFDDGEAVAPRKVLDISSNGFSNAGIDPTVAREHAVAAGITINALAILDEYSWLDEYYGEKVVGGPSAFVETAEDRDSFAEAILRKLVAEIAALPAPRRLAGAALLDRPPPLAARPACC